MGVQAILKGRVDQAVDDGAGLEEVEAEVIAPAHLSAEQRDALWLYAWGLLDGDDGFRPARTAQRFSR